MKIIRTFRSRSRPHMPPHRTIYDRVTGLIDCTCEGFQNKRKCWHATRVEAEATHPPLTAPRLLDGTTDDIATVAQMTAPENCKIERCPECGAPVEKESPTTIVNPATGARRLGTVRCCTRCAWAEVK